MKFLIKLTAFCFACFFAVTPVLLHAQSNASARTEKTGKSPKSVKAVGAPKMDINTAPVAELQTLPGIDADTANKIIASRPYANKAQLKSRNIVSDDLYKKITDLIVAKQPAEKSRDSADSERPKNKKTKAGTK